MDNSQRQPSTDPNPRNQVESFVGRVSQRLNRHRLWLAFWWCTASAGVVMLGVALVYVWQGFQVPATIYSSVFGASAVSAIVGWFLSRVGTDRSAQYADRFFGLKDTVRSCLNFARQGKTGGFYDLQAEQAKQRVEEEDAASIPFKFPYRIAGLAILTVAIAISLGFKGPSPEVIALQKQRESTLQMTAKANQQLKELIEELESSIDDEQLKKMVDPKELKKWVDELKNTDDHKEALRQYARLELKLNRASEALEQRKDEKLMERVAEELKKENETKKLGDQLKQKKYKEASEKLRSMKPRSKQDVDLKKLSERRKEIAKLKALANRMANAARSTQTNKSNSGKSGSEKNDNAAKNQSASANSKSQGSKGAPSDSSMDGQASEGSGSELSELLEDFEMSTAELDRRLKEIEQMRQNDLDIDPEDLQECEICEQELDEDLEDLAKKWMEMARKRSAQEKLKMIGRKAADAQGLGVAIAQANAKGGKKAGTGSVNSGRDEKDDRIDNGQYTKLKGIKGEGPSLTKIESADDGTGVSSRQHKAQQREFKRQYESFVNREDIPEDLKAGVKNYFTNIHSSDDESTEPKQ
ncbi:MAG: hypothetical protein AAFN77_11205 [Planctomycetota bacterium]